MGLSLNPRIGVVLGMILLAQVASVGRTLCADDPSQGANWYQKSFFLLHLDHHTTNQMAVGRDADPDETARLIDLIKPDVIQIHAKGNPGWTTYPSQVGFTPPLLARDVMQVWTDIAKTRGYAFSAYFNIGRDREIMRRHPQWNRVRADGTPWDNMLCYHSGVAEAYLWPMVDEIIDRYHPAGFWFDGSCFTVRNCYCAKCREQFEKEYHLPLPKTPQQPGWKEFKEMQRQIYREFCEQTAARIKRQAPECLVCFNWAYSLRMPEEPPPGIDYFSGDHGCQVDELAADAIWYDSQGRPFDLMTTIWYADSQGQHNKPAHQLQQEMAIIIAHGGRYFAWDNPTPESALRPERYEMMAQVVTPFLRSRQPWCQSTRALPDVALFHGAAAHYFLTEASPVAFPRENPPLLAACESLRRLHLTPEMISDRRLEAGDIRGKLLILEDTSLLTDTNRQALRRYIENGGQVLLTGKAVVQSGLADDPVEVEPQVKKVGRGKAYLLSRPLFQTQGEPDLGSARLLLEKVLPPGVRRLITSAPESVEIVLRERGDQIIVHFVNVAKGTRSRDPKSKAFVSLRIDELPPAPPCRVSVALDRRPKSVLLQPQDKPVVNWAWNNGRVEFEVPGFDIHQMVVITLGGDSTH
jgi:hypothetical protein